MRTFDMIKKLRYGEYIDIDASTNANAPYFYDGERIRIYPYIDRDPVIGDIVLYFMKDCFDLHRISNIVEDYFFEISPLGLRPEGFVTRDAIFGYVVPHRLIEEEQEEEEDDDGVVIIAAWEDDGGSVEASNLETTE